MIPLKDDNPTRTFPFVNWALIAVNVAVFFYQVQLPQHAAQAKLAFPLAPTLGWIVTARLVDRVGKGIRGAPRDALITDLTPANVRGAAFGLRQALDTVGAIAGPLFLPAHMRAAAALFTLTAMAVAWLAPAVCSSDVVRAASCLLMSIVAKKKVDALELSSRARPGVGRRLSGRKTNGHPGWPFLRR